MTNKKKNKKWEVKFAPSFWESADRLFSNKLKYLIPRKLSDWKYEIKWAWQRVFRGYDDRITWEIDHWLVDYLPEIIRKMKNNLHGYPSNPFEKKTKLPRNEKEWKDILEKIAVGFESASKIINDAYIIKTKEKEKDGAFKGTNKYKFDKKLYNKFLKEFDSGIKLFHEFFFNLWD